MRDELARRSYKVNVLVLGGSKFVGRHIAEAFVGSGADVTLFNRGNTYGAPVSGVQHIHGDRKSDLHRIGDGTWDAVIDTSAYVPLDAELSVRYFASRTARYLFVSTMSVYSGAESRFDEDAMVDVLPPHAGRAHMSPQTYGALKALCERVVESTFRHRATVVRPGLVAGPHDPTDRFTYWPVRIATGGSVLLPHAPGHPVQYIDARDLAEFVVSLVRSERAGTYNAATTPGTVTFGTLFEACRAASRAHALPVYCNEQRLLADGIQPWSDLPLWIPSAAAEFAFLHAPNTRARNAGLRLRSVGETARDVLAWARRVGKRVGQLGAGLTQAHESRLLSA